MSFLFRWVRSLFTTAGSINPLAIAVYGLLIGYFALNQYEQWMAERKARKQSEAIVERCAQDVIDRKTIEAEAEDAINNDPDNSFINQ